MKTLVTGNLGFVGSHLVHYINQNKAPGDKIFGLDIKTGDDFCDYEKVRKIIDIVRPDKIYHIGAQAYIPESFIDPYRTFETNTIGSLNILEAVRRIGLKTKILMCGTSEEYGDTEDPVTEESKLKPLSPYAVSKAAMDHLGQLYSEAYNMDVVVTRTFNHTGPGRGEQYAESAWAKQIVEIERGTRQILRHGDLEPIRNYTDVRDVVRAYTLAIDLPSGVYNICSNQNVTMLDVMDILIQNAKVPITTESDVTLFRPRDFSFNKPSAAKFIDLTGWEPKYKLEQTLLDILEYWRNG